LDTTTKNTLVTASITRFLKRKLFEYYELQSGAVAIEGLNSGDDMLGVVEEEYLEFVADFAHSFFITNKDVNIKDLRNVVPNATAKTNSRRIVKKTRVYAKGCGLVMK